MQPGRLIIMGIAPIFALSILAGCGSSSKTSSTTATTGSSGAVTVPTTTATSGTTIPVTLGDPNGLDGPMTLVTSVPTAPAGDVTFVVKNIGTIDHEMVVLKTTVAFNQLPITDAGDPPAPVSIRANKVSETNSVGDTGEPNLKPGEIRTFTIKNMMAGSYALVCNIALHYGKGMRAAFTVK